MATTFLKTHIDLGAIKVGVQQVLHFPYNETLKMVTKMVSPCDCSTPMQEKDKSRIVIKYTPKNRENN